MEVIKDIAQLTYLQEVVKMENTEEPTVKHYSFIGVHPTDANHLLLLDPSTGNAKKIWHGDLTGGTYFTHVEYDDIIRFKIEYHERRVSQLKSILTNPKKK